MSYYRDTYLKSGHWKALRNARLDYSNRQCAICGAISSNNDVHHIDYTGSLWDVSVSDLRVLCRMCHTAVHDYEKITPGLDGLTPRQKWSAVFAAMTDPIYKEKKRIRRERKKAHRDAFNNIWRPVFEICSTHPLLINLLVNHLSIAKKKEERGLQKIRENNLPGRETEYRRLLSAWLQNSSLSPRSRVKFQEHINHRRSMGLKVVAYRCEATENGNALVDIDTLKKKPDRTTIRRWVLIRYFPELMERKIKAIERYNRDNFSEHNPAPETQSLLPRERSTGMGG